MLAELEAECARLRELVETGGGAASFVELKKWYEGVEMFIEWLSKAFK